MRDLTNEMLFWLRFRALGTMLFSKLLHPPCQSTHCRRNGGRCTAAGGPAPVPTVPLPANTVYQHDECIKPDSGACAATPPKTANTNPLMPQLLPLLVRLSLPTPSVLSELRLKLGPATATAVANSAATAASGAWKTNGEPRT